MAAPLASNPSNFKSLKEFIHEICIEVGIERNLIENMTSSMEHATFNLLRLKSIHTIESLIQNLDRLESFGIPLFMREAIQRHFTPLTITPETPEQSVSNSPTSTSSTSSTRSSATVTNVPLIPRQNQEQKNHHQVAKSSSGGIITLSLNYKNSFEHISGEPKIISDIIDEAKRSYPRKRCFHMVGLAGIFLFTFLFVFLVLPFIGGIAIFSAGFTRVQDTFVLCANTLDASCQEAREFGYLLSTIGLPVFIGMFALLALSILLLSVSCIITFQFKQSKMENMIEVVRLYRNLEMIKSFQIMEDGNKNITIELNTTTVPHE